ncbi:MAG: type II toxin-antitoxin system VapC family toxin [Oceanicaulis sp.]
MIVADSSAILAILFNEPYGPECTFALESAQTRLMSAVNYVEAGTVLTGRQSVDTRAGAVTILDSFLATLRITIVPVDEHLARAAVKARIAYGRGFGTRGGLNFGDSFAYALAKHHAAPLLYVGDDFSLTDIRSAL